MDSLRTPKEITSKALWELTKTFSSEDKTPESPLFVFGNRVFVIMDNRD